MGDLRNAYRIPVGNAERKSQAGEGYACIR
jgi:hypothetical protein